MMYVRNRHRRWGEVIMKKKKNSYDYHRLEETNREENSNVSTYIYYMYILVTNTIDLKFILY